MTGVSRGEHGVSHDGMRLRACRGCDNEGENILYIVKRSCVSTLGLACSGCDTAGLSLHLGGYILIYLCESISGTDLQRL